MKSTQKSYQIRILFLGIFCLGFVLSSCGFQPMYGNVSSGINGQNTEQLLRRIEIGLIPDYEGQFLRNELIDRLHNISGNESPLYSLEVQHIQETKRDLDITKESDATIAQLRLSTTAKLIRNRDKKILLEKNFWTTTSYNILDSQFTTRVSRNYARESGLKDIAAQIERQVALALKNEHNDR